MTAAAGWLDLPGDTLFGLANLPYGVVDLGDGRPRVAVAIGDRVLDAGAAATAAHAPFAELLTGPLLDPLLAAGRPIWEQVRAALTDWLTDETFADRMRPHLHPRATAACRLPFAVGDYVDFYASEHHATNVGKIFRPGSAPLTPNWKHLPIGYHGRSGSVVVSGTDNNGAPTRTGDIFGSGTVSGPERSQRGSLLEMSWGATEPLVLPDGSTRTFLEDGDTVVLTATAPGPDGSRIGLGEVSGTVRPARS